jgi:hypothetical protein
VIDVGNTNTLTQCRPVGALAALPATPEKLIVAHVDMDAFYVRFAPLHSR